MLNALYHYARDHSLVPPIGYVEKSVKAFVSLSSYNENYIEIEMGGEKELFSVRISEAWQKGRSAMY